MRQVDQSEADRPLRVEQHAGHLRQDARHGIGNARAGRQATGIAVGALPWAAGFNRIDQFDLEPGIKHVVGAADANGARADNGDTLLAHDVSL